MKNSDNHNCSNFKDFRYSGKLKILNQELIVENFPAEKCSACGDVYFDGTLLMKLEKDFLNNITDIQSKYPFIKSITKIE